MAEIARERLIALRPGCSAEEIEKAERELGVAIPESLRTFLQATNGLTDLAARYEYGWNIEAIVTENRRVWSDAAMPLDNSLIGFGGDGAGGWFCLALDPQDDPPVVHWSWIDGEAEPYADDLLAFWQSWLSGH